MQKENSAQFEQLMLIVQGHVANQCLVTGIDLELFDLLDAEGPLTREAIMTRLNIEEIPAKILLRALFSLDLLTKKDDRYNTNAIATKYLCKNSPDSIKDILGWQSQIVYPAIVHLTDAVKSNRNVGLKEFAGEGETLYERLQQNDALETVFQKAMTALSKSANAEFYDAVDLSSSKLIVDIGGGEGTNLRALLNKYPDKKGIIFDSQTVCSMAEKNIKEWQLNKRLSTFPGDLFENEFPPNIDTILFCHMFTIWSDDRICSILDKCHRSLPENGKVIVFNMLSNDNEFGPLSCALGSPYFLAIATGEGKIHTLAEYKEWFNKSGFSSVEYHTGLPFDHGYIVATK